MSRPWKAPAWLDAIWDDVQAANADADHALWRRALGYDWPRTLDTKTLMTHRREWKQGLGASSDTLLRGYLSVWWWTNGGDVEVRPTLDDIRSKAAEVTR